MGFSIAALILGILGVVLSPLLVGGPIGVAAVILGVCHLRRSPNWRTTAGWGTGLGIAAILATLAIGSIYLLGFQLVRQVGSPGTELEFAL